MISQTALFISHNFVSFLLLLVAALNKNVMAIAKALNFLSSFSVKECGPAEREVYANEYSERFGYQRLVFFPEDRVIGFYLKGEMLGGAVLSHNFDKITNRLDSAKKAEFESGIEGKKCFMTHGLWVRPGQSKALAQFILFNVNLRLQLIAAFGRYQATVFDCLKSGLHEKKYLPMNPDHIIENMWNEGPHWVYRLDINVGAYVSIFTGPIRKMICAPKKKKALNLRPVAA